MFIIVCGLWTKTVNTTYSKTIPVKLDQPENVFSVYPNPLDNYTTLSIYATKPATGMLRLIDNSGKQLMTKSFKVTNGNNSMLVDQLGYLAERNLCRSR